MAKTKEAVLMDSIETVDETSVILPGENEPKRVVPGDPEWSDFVISQLIDGEYIENKGKRLPLTDALPRVVTKLLGSIVQSKSRLVDRSEDENPTVTIEHDISIDSNGNYTAMGSISYFTGIADGNVRNIDPVYNKYLSANAATRAKGRALRDALMLRVCVAEELSKVAEQDDSAELDKITTTQKAAIENLCKKMKIDTYKFINQGVLKYGSLEEVTNGKAKTLMSVLNKYQQGTDPPENILL